jgi:hypothetical protein
MGMLPSVLIRDKNNKFFEKREVAIILWLNLVDV